MSVGSFNLSRPPPGLSGIGFGHAASAPFLTDADAFSLDQLERLAHASLQSLEAVMAIIQSWREAGHGLDDIYSRAVTPCARLLGHWWSCDIADFAQVTIASTNLHRVLHRLSAEFCAPGADQPAGLSLLLATEPQSQHTMGAFMLGEFFRRHGWGVQLLTPHDGEDVLSHLRRDWFDAIGLSISTGRQLQALKSLIPRLRAQSPNPHLCVLVGGPLTLSDPQALASLDVELVGGDARETVESLSLLALARKN